MKRIGIYGAGITGLAAAWYAQKKYPNATVTVYEKTDRAGGWIDTYSKDGFLFEMGPRSCRPFGAGVDTLQLVQELGLENQVVLAPREAHRRFLYQNGKLNRLPNSLSDFVTLPWMWKFLPSIIKEPFLKQTKLQDESIASFFTRRFSSVFADTFVDPMVSGIFAGDMSQLSLRACFPQIDPQKSLILSALCKPSEKIEDPFIKRVQKSGLFSFKNGMKTLVDALSDRLNIQYRKPIDVNNPPNNDLVINTLPGDLPCTSVAVVSIGYKQPAAPQNGFGYLIPRSENTPVLGVVFDSCVFPEQNRSSSETRLTVMIGGAHMHDFDAYTEEDFIQMSLKHLQISKDPDSIHCKRARFAIPQYPVGYQLRDPKEGRIGSFFTGVSVNDCIRAAKHAVHKEFSL